DRHGRHVPGPGGARRVLLDGVLERGGRAARPGLPLLAEPPQRRDLAREVPRVPRREPAPARRGLPHRGADAARERALPARGACYALVGLDLVGIGEREMKRVVVGIHEAKTTFSKLVREAEAGTRSEERRVGKEWGGRG